MKKVREIEADGEILPSEKGVKLLKDDPFIGLVARMMDEAFTVPFTSIRFGLDPLIGLLPGLGPVASAVISLVLVGMSARLRVPKRVLALMTMNILMNAVLDAVPVVGDGLSIFFRSNSRNYALLREHAGTARPVSRGDWWFLFGLLGVAGAVIFGVLFGLFYVVWRIGGLIW